MCLATDITQCIKVHIHCGYCWGLTSIRPYPERVKSNHEASLVRFLPCTRHKMSQRNPNKRSSSPSVAVHWDLFQLYFCSYSGCIQLQARLFGQKSAVEIRYVQVQSKYTIHAVFRGIGPFGPVGWIHSAPAVSDQFGTIKGMCECGPLVFKHWKRWPSRAFRKNDLQTSSPESDRKQQPPSGDHCLPQWVAARMKLH